MEIIIVLIIVTLLIGIIFLPINQQKRDDAQINPWKRYFARVIDTQIYAIVILITAFFLGFSLAMLGLDESTINILAFLVLFLIYFVIEPIFLFKFGNTLGKKLFKINLAFEHNQTFASHLKRWIVINLRMLPLISLIALPRTYRVLKQTGDTAYDRKLGITVTTEKISAKPYLVLIFAFVLSIIITIASNLMTRETIKNSIRDSVSNSISMEDELNEIVLDLKLDSNLPVLLDDNETQWVDVKNENNSLVYVYDFPNYEAKDIDVEFLVNYLRSEALPNQVESYCLNAEYYISRNIDWVWRYYSADDVYITENRASPNDCL